MSEKLLVLVSSFARPDEGPTDLKCCRRELLLFIRFCLAYLCTSAFASPAARTRIANVRLCHLFLIFFIFFIFFIFSTAKQPHGNKSQSNNVATALHARAHS